MDKNCLSFEDYAEMGRSSLDVFQDLQNQFPDSSTISACNAFCQHTLTVESILRCTFYMATNLVRRCEDLNNIQSIWEVMSDLCDASLETLKGLKDLYPDCGAPELYDYALDLKLAAGSRRNNAKEELECVDIEIPENLFPSQK